MPSSQYYHISKLMEMIISLDPKSVLDIGSGFGKFGVLCREYLELWDGRQKYEFERRIDCVEVFQKYITPLHKYVYDNIYNENILDIAPRLNVSYDLILLIDVLEHFEKNDGILLLKTLLQNHGCILVSTPKIPTPQQDAFGNVYETHRSAWSMQELQSQGFSAFISDDVSLICLLSSNKKEVDLFNERIKVLKKHGKPPIEIRLKKIARHIPGASRAYKRLLTIKS